VHMETLYVIATREQCIYSQYQPIEAALLCN
jgi:hypothetical protein